MIRLLVVGTIAHSCGNSVKYSSHACVLGSTHWMASNPAHATTW